ncbi:MAG: DUF1453 family protein [Novosphingobium sp.]|nr:DUF1453 family protein [Novosphingobium sp.]
MPGQSAWIGTALPLLILALIMAFRFRNLSQPRRLRPERLWIAPVLYLALVALALVEMPPVTTGWLAFGAALLVGAAVGWQRARFMRIEHDPVADTLTIRQSPAALLLILVIVAIRRIGASATVLAQRGGSPLSPQALWLTDALLGFALGMIAGQRTELWLRARQLRAAALPQTFE